MHVKVLVRPIISTGAIADLLSYGIAADAHQRVFELVSGASRSPLQGLISCSLDLDKIEYLKRDAFMCGVPYGEIDVDRLVNSLVLVDGDGRGPSIGVLEHGLHALAALLFPEHSMSRNVLVQHVVRSA